MSKIVDHLREERAYFQIWAILRHFAVKSAFSGGGLGVVRRIWKTRLYWPSILVRTAASSKTMWCPLIFGRSERNYSVCIASITNATDQNDWGRRVVHPTHRVWIDSTPTWHVVWKNASTTRIEAGRRVIHDYWHRSDMVHILWARRRSNLPILWLPVESPLPVASYLLPSPQIVLPWALICTGQYELGCHYRCSVWCDVLQL